MHMSNVGKIQAPFWTKILPFYDRIKVRPCLLYSNPGRHKIVKFDKIWNFPPVINSLNVEVTGIYSSMYSLSDDKLKIHYHPRYGPHYLSDFQLHWPVLAPIWPKRPKNRLILDPKFKLTTYQIQRPISQEQVIILRHGLRPTLRSWSAFCLKS